MKNIKNRLILCLSILFVLLSPNAIVFGEETGELLPTETDKSESEETSTSFIVDKNNNVFHLPGCEIVSKIEPENSIETLETVEELKERYTPCEICKPESNVSLIRSDAEVIDNTKEAESKSEELNGLEETRDYIENTNTGVFHTTNCSHLAQMNDNHKSLRTTSAKYLITEEKKKPCEDCLGEYVAYYDANVTPDNNEDTEEKDTQETRTKATSSTPVTTTTVRRVSTTKTNSTSSNRPTTTPVTRTTARASNTRQNANPSTGIGNELLMVLPVLAILFSSGGLLLAYEIRKRRKTL